MPPAAAAAASQTASPQGVNIEWQRVSIPLASFVMRWSIKTTKSLSSYSATAYSAGRLINVLSS